MIILNDDGNQNFDKNNMIPIHTYINIYIFLNKKYILIRTNNRCTTGQNKW